MLSLYVKHVRRHRLDSTFQLKCPICGKCYRNFQSWQRHLQRTHFLVDTGCDPRTQEADFSVSDGDFVNLCSPGTSQQRHPVVSKDTARQKVASLVNLLKDNHLPEAACRDVLSACTDIAVSAVEEYKEVGQAEGTSVENLSTLSFLSDFQSNYKFCQYVQSELPYVEPQTIAVGEDETDTYQYISLLNQIKQLVQLESLKSYVFERPEQNVNQEVNGQRFYIDVFDGSVHPLKQKDEIYLSLSYDDFEVANPLGSAATVHKLAALHFSVLNAPVEARSKQNTLFPLILSRTSILKQVGWNVLLRPLIRDLHQLLTEGIEVFIDETPKKVTGKLLFICGDNLAVHSIAGFTESFSKSLCCRYCVASPEEWQSQFTESNFTLRDENLYQAQLRQVLDSRQDRKVISETGIKAGCAFSELPEFRVTEKFPPDLAHDILGGVVPCVISLVLTTLIKQKFISLDIVNDRIKSFPWNWVGDRPKDIRTVSGSSKVRIRQSASQTWTLLRYIPLLVGDLIPADSVEWQLITELCDIVENLFSLRFCEGDLVFLDQKISAWLHALKVVHPEFRIKPKFHYMIHYVSQIRRHGPLRNCWTLRYESKYGFLKGLIKESKNFRNIAKTIASKHQTYIAFQLNSGSLFRTGLYDFHFETDLEGVPVAIATEAERTGARLSRKFTWNGTEFRAGHAVQLGDADCELAELVAAVCQSNGKVQLVLRLLETSFLKHINAYEIVQVGECILLGINEVRSPKPVAIHTVHGSRYAVLKCHI